MVRSLVASAQNEDGVTYAHKIGAEDLRIDWTRAGAAVDRQIRGLSPHPGCWCEWTPEGEAMPLRLKVQLSRFEPVVHDAAPGTLLDDRLLVACGSGAVRLLMLQRPGKGQVAADVFLNGAQMAAGTVLG